MTMTTIQPLCDSTVKSLLASRESPCLSVYVPTHRRPDEKLGDTITYRHLLEQLGTAIEAQWGREVRDWLLSPLQSLGADPSFWQHTGDGFAGFAAKGVAHVVPLDGPVEPLALVANRFHTLPLVSRLAATEYCHVIALTSRQARIFTGEVSPYGGDRLVPLPVTDDAGRHYPTGVILRRDVIDQETHQPHRVLHRMGHLGVSVHGGFGSRSDGINADTRRFFASVAHALGAARKQSPGLPLVFIGLPRLAATFRDVYTEKANEWESVRIHPHLMTDAELLHVVGDILRIVRKRRQANIVEVFLESRAKGRASDDFLDIAFAAVAGKVSLLVTERGRQEQGTIDPVSGEIFFPDPEQGEQLLGLGNGEAGANGVHGDLYAALGEIVIAHGGSFLTYDRTDMPTRKGVAAIYRYAAPR